MQQNSLLADQLQRWSGLMGKNLSVHQETERTQWKVCPSNIYFPLVAFLIVTFMHQLAIKGFRSPSNKLQPLKQQFPGLILQAATT